MNQECTHPTECGPVCSHLYRRTKPMRIAIVDDCAADAEALEEAIVAHLTRRGRPCETEVFSDGSPLFKSDALAYDLVFLDIFLGDENGIDIAERLREEHYPALVVFTTVSADHAVEGFRVRAFHYLMKPYSDDDLAAVLDEALARLATDETMLLAHDGTVPVRVPLSRIRYVQTDGHYLMVDTEVGLLRWRQVFAHLVDMLSSYPQFFTCHRGVMVNLDHVSTLTDDDCFIMDDGKRLSVRRSSRTEARRRYFDRLFTQVGGTK
ncbi:hypothetical protein EGYY_20650 [Eggerthella sp. YY7918]|nr:hypothetical protein EGYY_20650 [Eggerthella sp. YY7918]